MPSRFLDLSITITPKTVAETGDTSQIQSGHTAPRAVGWTRAVAIFGK